MRLKNMGKVALVSAIVAVLGISAFATNQIQSDAPVMTEVYYDFVEDGNLTGGKIIIENPTLTPQFLQEAAPPYNSSTVINNGPSENRVDLVFVGDGYTAADMDLYWTHVTNVLNQFFDEEALKEYAGYFNVHVVEVISNESGVDEPDLGIYRDTALDMSFDCYGVDRMICVDRTKAWEAAENAPDTDVVLAMANSTRYGGTGYTKIATFSGGNSYAVELALHEFGHSFTRLTDEYYYETGGTYPGNEPIEANASKADAAAQLASQLKWYLWLDLPEVDTFEGAKTYQYGVYRPIDNSKMRSLGRSWGPVNTEQFVFKIYEAVSPIDSSAPLTDTVLPAESIFSVTSQTPLTHTLNVEWLIDGTSVPNSNQTSFCPNMYMTVNTIQTLTVRVTDDTALVRDENKRVSLLTAERSWQVWKVSADFNNDGTVDLTDLAGMAMWWLSDNQDYDIAPIGGDGIVNFQDFAAYANCWVETDQSAPTPNPMIWESGHEPAPCGNRSIEMTAATATDDKGFVQYYFNNTTDPNHNSDWQGQTYYLDTALDPNITYTYRVKARDLAGNETGWSPEASATPIDVDPNLVSHWKFDDGSGTIANDSAGTNTGTLVNDPTWTTGQIDGAVSFDGTNDYVDVGTMGDFGSSYLKECTVSLWVKSAVTNKIQTVLGTANLNATTAYSLNLNCNSSQALSAGAIGIYVRDQSGSDVLAAVNTNTGITDGQWHHLVVVLKKAEGKAEIYVDGQSKTVTHARSNAGTNFANFQYPLVLGGNNNRGAITNYLTDSLDDVMIFNKALSAEEVQQIYQSGL